MQDIQYQINQGYYKLRKSEKKVADYFLQEVCDVEDMTLQKLEVAIGVAQPTIVRFIKAIGYASFRHFKYGLLVEQKLHPINTLASQCAPEAQSMEEWAKDTTTQAQKNIAAIWKYLTFEKLREATKLLHAAKTIVIFGNDDCYTMQYEWAQRMAMLQKRVVFREQVSLQKLEGAHMQKGDIACVFENTAVFDTQIKQQLHNQGVSLIVISRFAMDKQADIALFHPHNSCYQACLDSSSLTLLDLLMQGVIHYDYAYYQAILNQTEKADQM